MRFHYPDPAAAPMDGQPSPPLTSVILISNLHCSSCVHTIESTLNALHPTPSSVQVSIVSQSVTVEHSQDLTIHDMEQALQDAGFDVPQAPNVTSENVSSITDVLRRRRKAHVENCSVCTAEESRSHSIALGHGDDHASDTTVDTSHGDHEKTDIDHPSGPLRGTFFVGGMTCASCSGTITRILAEVDGLSDVAVDLLGNSMTLVAENKALMDGVMDHVEDIGYECRLIEAKPLVMTPSRRPKPPRDNVIKDEDALVRATYSVGGMTCAACIGTITRMLSEVPGLSEISVNLLGSSMTLIAENKDLAHKVIEHVDDIGYECTIVEVHRVEQARSPDDAESLERTVDIKIEGMFCKHCPEQIMGALKTMIADGRIRVDKPLTSIDDPIFTITYEPSSPTFTIRDILSLLSSTPSPGPEKSPSVFKASVYHPPSLESLSRKLQATERKIMLRRLLLTVLIAIPTFIIGIVFMTLLSSTHRLRMWAMEPILAGSTARAVWALFILATPVEFYSALGFHRRSIKEIKALWRKGSKTPIWQRFLRFGSMNLLISLGVSVAYFASIALLAISSSKTPSSPGQGDTTTYFDSVVFLCMFLLFGRYLEAYSKSRTADAVASLGKLRPATALLVGSTPLKSTSLSSSQTSVYSPRHETDLEKGLALSDDNVAAGYTRIPLDFMELHDVVKVLPGSTPPADGLIVSEEPSLFDESSLTGESRGVTKMPGDRVFVGTICKGRAVDVRIDKLTGETMLDHVVDIVRKGQANRAPIERVVDVVTGYFVPVVVLLSLVTWLVWLILGETGALPPDYLDISIGGWPVWSLRFAIAVFVVACPCGIGLAAPTALLVGSGLAAKFGILARGGGEAFQEAAQLDIIVFDKTGTITQGGEPKVTDALILGSEDAEAVASTLGMTLALESTSSHPLALAMSQYCQQKGASNVLVKEVDEIPGRGIRGAILDMGCTAIIGNEAFMNENGVQLSKSTSETLNVWKTQGKSVVLVARSSSAKAEQPEINEGYALVAAFAIADPLRPEAKEVIERLQEDGLGTWMISGDNEITAKAVAKMVGIPEANVIAGVLPHEKADRIQWLQRTGMKRRKQRGGLNSRAIVAMCGDGINDAPALAAADVGIAIGSGSDVAISTASFILVSSNLKSILTLTDLSRTVFRRIKFNFAWAAIYNLAAIPIAAGVIYPAGHARLDPVWASLAMALSSVSVVTSSLLLKFYREPKARELTR